METSSELQAVSKKERLKLVLKFLLVGFVFWFLFKKGLVTAESFQQLLASPFTITVMVTLMTINTFIGTMRWRGLLSAKVATLSFKRVLELNLIGGFFNVALPGAVSGDFVKAIHVSRDFPEKRPAVFGSMLLDRILGMSAMVFVASVSAVISQFIDWGGSLPTLLLVSIECVGLGLFVFLIYMFLSHKRDPLFNLIQFITKRHTRLEVIDKLYIGVMDYRSKPKAVLLAVSQSILIHILLILIVFSISEAVSISPISLMALAVIVPIGILATTIPVLPAGVGTGHAAFFALFQLVGSSQGAEIFSLIVLMHMIVGGIGGVIYLRSTAKDAIGTSAAIKRE